MGAGACHGHARRAITVKARRAQNEQGDPRRKAMLEAAQRRANRAMPIGMAPSPLSNIVLMMADDMGWGDVSFNNVSSRIHQPGAGGEHYKPNPPRTPEIDKMAFGANSLLFHRFYAGSAVCSPTRASVARFKRSSGSSGGSTCLTGPPRTWW